MTNEYILIQTSSLFSQAKDYFLLLSRLCIAAKATAYVAAINFTTAVFTDLVVMFTKKIDFRLKAIPLGDLQVLMRYSLLF